MEWNGGLGSIGVQDELGGEPASPEDPTSMSPDGRLKLHWMGMDCHWWMVTTPDGHITGVGYNTGWVCHWVG